MIFRAIQGPRDVVAVLCLLGALSTIVLRGGIDSGGARWFWGGLALLLAFLLIGAPMIFRMIVDEGKRR